MTDYTDIGIERVGMVGVIEIQRPPHNYFDVPLIRQIAAALRMFDADPDIRSSVLCAQGKSFCAGANFTEAGMHEDPNRFRGGTADDLYMGASRIFEAKKPIVAAVQGAAIGGGLGLAVSADFRITCPEARFAANFTRLGFHPGFGLTITLPELIGKNRAELMFYTGRRIGGEEATAIGLANVCVPRDEVRTEALRLATEIAECAPLAVVSTRTTMRGDLAKRVRAATVHESAEQSWLRQTSDFKEGVSATAERRRAVFTGA